MDKLLEEGIEFGDTNNLDTIMITNYKNRRNEFRRLFRESGAENSKLIGDYSCALYGGSPKILQQGRMYLTSEYACFYCKLINEIKIIIHFSEIQDVTKEKTALVFPNAIQIMKRDETKYFFASFTSRDKTYQILERCWIECTSSTTVPPGLIWDRIRENYGNDLGFSTDDPDYEISKASQYNVVFKSFRRPSEQKITSSQESLYESIDDSGSIGKKSRPSSMTVITNGNCSESDVSSSEASMGSGLGSSGRRSRKGSFVDIQLEDSTNLEIQMGVEYRKVSRELIKDTELSSSLPNRKSNTFSPNNSLSSIDEHRIIVSPPTIDTECYTRPPAQCNHHTHFPNKTLDYEFDLNVTQLFQLLFTDTPFYRALCSMRSVTDITQSSWAPDIFEGGPCKKRMIYYTVNLKNRIGPKCTPTVETQLLLKDSVEDYMYIVESTIQNTNVPLADSFHSTIRYCLLYVAPNKTRVKSSFQIVYDKSPMFPAKSIIESAVKNGCTDYCRDMKSALLEEIKKRKKEALNDTNSLAAPSSHNSHHKTSIEDKYSGDNLVEDDDDDENIDDISRSHEPNSLLFGTFLNNFRASSWTVMVAVCFISFLLLYLMKNMYSSPIQDEFQSSYQESQNNVPPTNSMDQSLEELVNVIRELKTVVQLLHLNMEKLTNSTLMNSQAAQIYNQNTSTIPSTSTNTSVS